MKRTWRTPRPVTGPYSVLIYLLSLVVIAVPVAGQGSPFSVYVDASRPEGEINRALFSLVNYQYLYANGTGKALQQFRILKPEGSQARIETRFADVEPRNDNGDPNRLNERQFFAGDGIAYVADAQRFVSDVARIGMAPVLLLAYNTPWLSDTGRATGAPTDIDEWVEFAVEIVRAYGGVEAIPYVEVWNEPNIEQYWTGSDAEYFRLFNATARALHREFPGIRVGGPAASPGGNYPAYLREFLDACGEQADFISYHPYGERVDKIVRDVAYYNGLFQQETGKSGPRVMITESDHRIPPDDKFRYLVERQLALLDVQEHLIGFHHFSLPYYAEGSRVFGLIDTDGGVVPANYYPYWAFKDIRGERLPAQVSGSAAGGGLSVISAASSEAGRVSTLISAGDRENTTVSLTIDGLAPTEGPRVASVFSITAEGARLVATDLIDAGVSRWRSASAVPVPTDGVLVINVEDQENLTGVWMDFHADRDSMVVGERFSGTISVTNLTTEVIRGRLNLLGQPEGWEITLEGGIRFEDLAPGDTLTRTVDVRTTEATAVKGNALYAFAAYRTPGSRSQRAGSVPVRIKALAPVTFRVLPLELYGKAAGQTQTRVRIENTFDRSVEGDFFFRLPDGWSAGGRVPYELNPGRSMELDPVIVIPSSVEPGQYPVTAVCTFRGMEFVQDMSVEVRSYPDVDSTPVNLGRLFNADLFTEESSFADVSNFGGPFSYPAAFFPSDEQVRYLGVRFSFPPTGTGEKNAVRVDGQRVRVPRGQYERLSLLTAATNGDKTVVFTLQYSDGTRVEREITVTDWCREIKYDETVVERAPYRHHRPGILRDAVPRIMKVDIPLDPDRELRTVSFPEETDFWVIAATLVR